MNKPAGQVKVQVINEAQTIVTPGTGLVYIVGPTLKGLKANPKYVINSVAKFISYYGDDNGIFTAIAKRILAQNVQLRVSRVVSDTATIAESEAFVLGTTPMFKFKAKAPGKQYNNVSIKLESGENSYFNIYVNELDSFGNVIFKEKFINLIVPEDITLNPHYLEPIKNSTLIDPVYIEDSGSGSGSGSGSVIWEEQTFNLTGGSNGGNLTSSEYVNALSGFNSFYDGKVICFPSLDDDEPGITLGILNAALTSYVEARKDLMGIIHIPNRLNSADLITEYIEYPDNGISVSKYIIVSGGGVKTSLFGNSTSEVPETGFYAAKLAEHYGIAPWKSPSGFNYGIITGINGPVNNFGSPAYFNDLNAISSSGVNMLINRNNVNMFWTGYTMALDNSPEKFISIIFLELYLISILKPTLERYISEPNDFDTWSNIYYVCKPIMEDLIEKRALFAYVWDGDQFATSLEDLQVNDPQDVQDGIYKIQVQIKTVSPIVIIDLAIILTNAGVEFK